MKTIIGRSGLSLVFLLATIPLSVFANPYKPPIISDVQTIEYSRSYLDLGDRVLDLSLSYQTRNAEIDNRLYRTHNPEHLSHVIKDSWGLMKQFLRSNNISYRDCRSDYNLNLFILNTSVMFDSERFEKFFADRNLSSSVIYGYYDSTLEIEKNSVMLLTNVSENKNDSIFAHEMAHYWWDRLCVANHWQTNYPIFNSSENFALRFQSYYEDRR